MNITMIITLLLCLVINIIIIDAYNNHRILYQRQHQHDGYKQKHNHLDNSLSLYSKASYNRLGLKRLLMSQTDVQSGSSSNPSDVAANRVYKPRSDPTRVGSGVTISDNNARSYTPPGREGGSSRSYTPPGRSYTPPGRDSSIGGSGGQNKNWSDGPAILLHHPQLLVKYKVPKEISEFKQQLLTQQKQFAEAFESSQSSWGSRGGASSYGGGGGRGGGGYGGGKDNFFDAFDSAPLSFNDGKGGKGKKKEETKGGKKPAEEGRLKKVKGSDKGEDDDVDYEDEIEGEEELEDDYYGDVVTDVTIADVPSDTLRNMETEGYSLEEMQMAIYGEFGIKVSINAVKRRLFDDKNERKGKKRTGKTRRDRNKARNARFNPVVDKGITLPEGNVIQVAELARLMDLGAGEVVKHLMMNAGVMATMNMNIDMNLAKQVIEAFGKKLAGEGGDDEDEEDDEDDDEEELDMIDINSVNVERLPRPPVVTIMGHVDHGKTTLLDSIRNSQVAAGEAGGITQAISAFKVRTSNDQDVTFIDTPGHAAFRDMRKRGANMTDIVVLVVAADDGIMEQTKESIAAAKAANCPIVIAINKIDKEGADPQAVMTALMSYDLLVEDFGGEIQCAKVSAKKGDGIEALLEKVLLQAEVMALKAPYETKAGGSVIEARVDKGLGPVVTALVQKGTLRVGDHVLAGPSWGRVRRIISDQGQNLKEAGPSTPVQIVGMSSVPNAGDQFVVTDSEEEAREVAEARQRLARQASGSQSISSILAQAAGIAAGTADNKEQIKVPILIKGDVSGSVEAIQSSILELQLSDEEATCLPDIVFAGVGSVTSSDVAIAAVSKAKIIAFNVAADMNAMDEARASNVEIGYYNVVYDLLDEIEAKIKKTLSPPPPGTLVGRAEIKKVFKIGKVGKIAGCSVTEGIIKMESQVRIMRGKRNPVFTGKLSTLKVVKDDVQEVPNGSECGMGFEDFQDLEEGDIVECFIGGQNE